MSLLASRLRLQFAERAQEQNLLVAIVPWLPIECTGVSDLPPIATMTGSALSVVFHAQAQEVKNRGKGPGSAKDQGPPTSVCG
jgi:hypothetical protein